MKILVIGSAGFIGRFLLKRLVDENHKVSGFDISSHPRELESSCKCFKGDLLSRQDLQNAAQGVDMIISLAAKHRDFGISRKQFFKVNKEGTQILLDVAHDCGVDKLIFYSTVAVYGTRRDPSTEEMIPLPDSDYGESKLAGENLVSTWCGKNAKRSVIIVRPTVIFGPENYTNVYNLIDQIFKKRFMFIGEGENIKSVAYVENLVDATIFLMDRLKPGTQIFNYSDEPQMTVSEIVEAITDYIPHGIPKIKIPLWTAVTFGSFFDLLGKITRHNYPITAARMKKFAKATHHKSAKIRALGFKQRIETKEGFRRMVEWYLATQVNG